MNSSQASSTTCSMATPRRPRRMKQVEWDGAPVKSVTYHGLRLEQDSGGWHLRIFVDV
jgi:SHS2 domain-containing protein